MPEGVNIELAHKLSEKDKDHSDRKKKRWEEAVEIFEAILLAVVAVSTAFSGYQAAKWDGNQSFLYGESSKLRFEADAATNQGEIKLSTDVGLLTSWLQANEVNDKKLEAVYERRFTPEYRLAFEQWIKLDPLNNPSAPPGPGYMPSYKNPDIEKGTRLNVAASKDFEQGTYSREVAEKYVRFTVLFASVLFLIAISQRFKVRGVRFATLGIACALLVFSLAQVVALPRL